MKEKENEAEASKREREKRVQRECGAWYLAWVM